MIRQKLIGLAVAAALALPLGGCFEFFQQGGTGTVPSQPPSQTIDITGSLGQIQSGIQQFCGYQVTGDTINAVLVALGVPYIGMVPDVVHQLCNFLGKSAARRGGPRAMMVRSKVDGRLRSVRVEATRLR